MRLSFALSIGAGITSFTGGGGKTTAIYCCARELAEEGAAVGVCTTTHMNAPDDSSTLVLSADFLRSDVKNGRTIVVADSCVDGRLCGISDGAFETLAACADSVLVEADGAKMFPLKAPRSFEPVIPAGTGRVVGVMGASAMGKTFAEACFHYELLGVAPDAVITPADMARIASTVLRKGVECPFTLLINQADAASREDLEELASAAQAERIVLASVKLGKWEIYK